MLHENTSYFSKILLNEYCTKFVKLFRKEILKIQNALKRKKKKEKKKKVKIELEK